MTWNRRAALCALLVFAIGLDLNAESPVPQRLTIKDAVQLALKNNLSVLVSHTQVQETEGTRERRRYGIASSCGTD